jgi:hypothetical protein
MGNKAQVWGHPQHIPSQVIFWECPHTLGYVVNVLTLGLDPETFVQEDPHQKKLFISTLKHPKHIKFIRYHV